MNAKVKHIEIRSRATKIKAEVVEYRKEKGPMRNDYTLLEYPYVRIDLDDEDYIIERLKYATSSGRYFKIGQIIDVFWYDNYLLYWDAYDNGIYKYFPGSWKLI
ncbi:hypothetical protein [Hyunsoonleella ulvae]|uniref:hypothetical protein n=1 Tax=Hyunsoonleella ulvae TaxID=2799948 RepID=UPI0019396521|nr:hypothetical protein [Hyunsoonleella ulvae]